LNWASTARFLGAALASCLISWHPPAQAGEFSVNPIRLEFGASARSGVIAVKNDGKGKLNFQLSASEWTQDAQGVDQYQESRDIVFFPRLMSVEPGQEAIVRVGVKNAVVPTEKTYRLFIEELPGAAAQPERGVQINVLIKFGAPIFVGPVKPQDALELEGPTMRAGVLKFSARNTGNRHQVVQRIGVKGTDAAGREVYALTLADRYLLAGTLKPYSANLSADQCAKITALEVEVKTDKADATRKTEVTRAMCP